MRSIAERIARIARATVGGGGARGSERDALRDAEALIEREKRIEAEARQRAEAARRAKEAARLEEKRKPKDNPKVVEALALFGLKPGTPFPEVSAAYRKRISAAHPDRNPGQAAGANDEAQRLNAAYTFLKKVYGRP